MQNRVNEHRVERMQPFLVTGFSRLLRANPLPFPCITGSKIEIAGNQTKYAIRGEHTLNLATVFYP